MLRGLNNTIQLLNSETAVWQKKSELKVHFLVISAAFDGIFLSLSRQVWDTVVSAFQRLATLQNAPFKIL